MVVNNNAAAVFMVLSAFAAGREVLVSRGEAVEIGGGFRIPDVLAQSGARLIEVGTTNRTYAHDYSRAWTSETAAILRVHPSNFRVTGFTSSADVADLAAIAHGSGGLLLDDLGSGALVDTARFGLAHEPTPQEALASGADLVMFSGDKLLGGPQCGIIAGRTQLLSQLRAHPLARALRVDKLTIAALNATLASYVEETAETELPLLRMLAAPLTDVRRRASRWAHSAGEAGSLRREQSMVGGGSLPGEGLPTWCAALATPAAASLAERLRAAEPAIIARIHDGTVLLDPRTVDRRDDRLVEAAIRHLLGPSATTSVDPRRARVL
jgi:L-seryl-tRNA(Ser) seleniumtransferase